MHLLLDTHVLFWAAGLPDRLPEQARELIEDAGNSLLFSAASLWEVTIKRGLGRSDFQVEPEVLRWGVLENGYDELAISGPHALAVATFPPSKKSFRSNPGGPGGMRGNGPADRR